MMEGSNMLTNEENDLMCRVGPGTPMGNLLRQYWLPSTVPSSLLPAPDCPPIRVRLLGENLIAFRTTSGKVGMVANACPHRGASLFFGRNEEEGLRCVYHGWKFDVDGNCVDMPSEPAESNFSSKVKVQAYPCIELNGMIWTYMGSREVPPPLPEFEFNTSAADMCFHPGFVFYDCNWVQSMEGDVDSAHIDYLHARLTPEAPSEAQVGFGQAMWNNDRTPILLVHPMEYGAVYAAQRQWDPGTNHYRIAQFLMPFYTIIPGSGSTVAFNAWVPLDDDHTVQISFRSSIREPVPESERVAVNDPYPRLGGYLPATSDPLTRWRSPANRNNDYLISYENQRTVMFSGIPREGKLQDIAVMESMGHIGARVKEHLGRSDTMIIVVRRTLLAAAKALQDEGILHPTVDNPKLYRVRSAEVLLPKEVDWLEATEPNRRADGGVRIKNFVTAEVV
jgi:phthalate 4,5-dioxygenase